jgi:hypothetical protein
MSSNNKICFFCKNSGENEKTYTGHTKHTCQKLANIECLACGAKGHTERYCDNSGKKYAAHAPKKEMPTEEWQEVTTKKTPLVFHVANNGAVVAAERPVTPPPPPKVDDETLFPSLTTEPVKPTAAKTLNFSALKFDKPTPQPTVVTSTVSDKEFPEHPVFDKEFPEHPVFDKEFPELPTRRTPPTRTPPPLPTIHECDVASMTKDEIVDTINSNLHATEVAERTVQQLTSVVATLSTSLQLMNSRYDAKCQEYDALLQAYNALIGMQQTSRWGEPGASWADEQ